MAPEPRMLFSWDDVETRPELQRLELALDALPDEALLAELGKRRGAGRNDFPVAAMWRAVIAGIVFQHASVESLLRELNRNPALLDLCGFNPLPVRRRGGDGRIADAVPNGWNVSRFLKTLVDVEEKRGLVSAMVDDLRAALMAEIPDFGRHLGYDGKAVESHSTGVAGRETGRTSDPDADWGKHETSGVGRDGRLWTKVTSWFGYKLHVIADTRHEIPVAVSLTRASASEVKELKRMASGLMERDPALAGRCSEFSADRGLDSGPLKAALWDRWRIRPFIDTRLMWRAERDEPGHDASVPVTRPLDPDRADTMVHSERGELSCVCPETGEQRGMAFEGFERDRETLKYRCPAAAGGFDCAGRAACLKMGGSKAGDYGRVVRIPLATADRRIFTPTPWGSPSWQRGYNRRSALERINSRIDRVYGMESHFVRGRERMELRCNLVVAVMMATALGHVRAGRPEMMRSLVRGPDLKAA